MFWIPEQIDRSTNTCIDLAEEYQTFANPSSFVHRCAIGPKKVLLSQRPGWREDMGNPFLEGQRVCPYNELTSAGERSTRRLRYEL